jgi:hypothetical protein
MSDRPPPVFSKFEWFVLIVLAILAASIGAPYLKYGYVGYYLSGKCPPTMATSIPQCHPRGIAR